jgi:hypothetical protein
VAVKGIEALAVQLQQRVALAVAGDAVAGLAVAWQIRGPEAASASAVGR